MTIKDLTQRADLTRHGRGTGALRTRRPDYVDYLPPCNDACPAGENIQAWLALAQDGEYEAAWRELVRNNPMPAIHGRVCYHPCEDACNRIHTDSSVSIHAVERFLGDLALEKGWQFDKPAKKTGKKILVVGAGPSGLSAAYHLATMGHDVEIREAGPDGLGIDDLAATADFRPVIHVAHEEPDRVPAWCGASDEFWAKAKAELDLARINLEDTRIRASFAGSSHSWLTRSNCCTLS